MSFIVYFFVLLVAAASVLFGLDWLNAPLPTMPKPPQALQASDGTLAKEKAKDDAKLNPVYPTKLGEAGNASLTTQTSPACDLTACARAYRSFNAADCTYQPIDGPRRLCRKGNAPARAAVLSARETSPTEAHAQACNVSACERVYSSFDASDCTYQPYGGPRRICTK